MGRRRPPDLLAGSDEHDSEGVVALERSGLAPDEAVYVGDIYSIDVLGARAAGMRAVLLDPGRCWGPRDCHLAPHVLGAVRLILDGAPCA